MELIQQGFGVVILQRKDGAMFVVDDDGFEAWDLSECPGTTKTLEFADWLALNEVMRKISRGKPKRMRLTERVKKWIPK